MAIFRFKLERLSLSISRFYGEARFAWPILSSEDCGFGAAILAILTAEWAIFGGRVHHLRIPAADDPVSPVALTAVSVTPPVRPERFGRIG